jgi:hypothetical protein
MRGWSLQDTKVLIVGAGPVGLTLAVDLGRRGVECTLIEKKDKPAFLPKMERVNARTMEIYRRMGLSRKIRAAGLSRHIPMDVYVVSSPSRRCSVCSNSIRFMPIHNISSVSAFGGLSETQSNVWIRRCAWLFRPRGGPR